MSTLQVSKLESLIVDKIGGLDYVSRVAYHDDGQEVVILAIHDYDHPERLGEMIGGIGDMGTEIEDEIGNRVIVALAINDGPDLPEGIFISHKEIYTREAGR